MQRVTFPVFHPRVRRQSKALNPANSSFVHSFEPRFSLYFELLANMATFADESGMDVSEEINDGSVPSFPPVSAVDANVSTSF